MCGGVMSGKMVIFGEIYKLLRMSNRTGGKRIENNIVSDMTNFVIPLCLSFINYNINNDKKVIQLVNNFSSLYEKEENKLPFHLNLLDVIERKRRGAIVETVHSTYLRELLGYKVDGRFPLLESFLKVMGIDKKVKFPEVPNKELYNIDVSIFDSDYAIIVENKINGAVDRDRQIYKYINIVKTKGYKGYRYKEEQIYVIYLAANVNCNPSDIGNNASLPVRLRERFSLQGRYINTTFGEKVIEWLDDVYSLNINDRYMASAIFQYRDYLKNRYFVNEMRIGMDKNLKNFVYKELNILDFDNDERISAISKLQNSISDIDRLKEYLTDFLEKEKESQIDIIGRRIREEHNIKIKRLDLSFSCEIIFSDVSFELSAHFDEDEPYIGIKGNSFHYRRIRDMRKVKEVVLEEVLYADCTNWNIDASDATDWFCYKYLEWNDVESEFCRIYESIISLEIDL